MAWRGVVSVNSSFTRSFAYTMGNTLSVAEANANAFAVRVKAEAEAAKIGAEANANVFAVRVKAEAETAKIGAEARAVTAKAAADTAKIGAERALIVSPLVALGGAALFLAVDFALHDMRSLQRWRLLKRLRRCEVPLTALGQPVHPLPSRAGKLDLAKLPMMVLGPTGCGKSDKLAQTARETALRSKDSELGPCPVVYIRMRQPGGGGSNARAADLTVEQAAARLEATAQQVFQQIGYPLRASYLSMLWPRQGSFFKIGNVEGEVRGIVQRACCSKSRSCCTLSAWQLAFLESTHPSCCSLMRCRISSRAHVWRM